MLWLISFLPLLCQLPTQLESVVLKINGNIDLGPKWIFEYDLMRQRSRTDTTNKGPTTLRDTVKGETPTEGKKKHRKRKVTTDIVFKAQQNYPPGLVIETFDSTKKHNNNKKTHATNDKAKVKNLKPFVQRAINNRTNEKKHQHNKNPPTNPSADANIVRTFNETPIQIEANYNSLIFSRNVSVVSTEPTTTTTETEERVTHFYVAPTLKTEIFESPHQVKEDERLRDFTIHVYKQSLRALDTIKSKVNNTKVKKKVDFITESYKDKFREFVRETQTQKISTRLGTQKVILNTVDTSNRILRRLVNYLAGEIENKPNLRDTAGVKNVLDKEVNNEVQSEYIHVCLRFSICRSSHGFMEFLINFFSEIAKNDDTKLRIATDAYIDIFENEEFSRVMDDKLKNDFVESNKKIEKMEPSNLRVGVSVLRNMVAARNMPLAVSRGASREVVERSVAIMDVFDALDQKLMPSQKNRQVWKEILQNLEDWRDGKSDNVVNIMQDLATHINTDAVNHLDDNTAQSIQDKLKIVFRDSDQEE